MTAADQDRSKLLVHAYVDGELDPVNAVAIEKQIAADPALAAERARVEALRRALRDKLPATELPAGLEARVRTAIGDDASEQRLPRGARWRHRSCWRW